VRLDHNQLGILQRATRPRHWFGVPEHHGSATISISISGDAISVGVIYRLARAHYARARKAVNGIEQMSSGFLETGTTLKNPNFAAMAESIRR
jgi:hypothetical protein